MVEISPTPASPGTVSPAPSPRKGFSFFHIFIGVVIGIILMGTGYLVYNLYFAPEKEPSVQVNKPATSSATPSAKKDETADWVEFVGDISLRGGDPALTTKVSLKHTSGYEIFKDEYGSTLISTPGYKAIIGPEKTNDFTIALYLFTKDALNTVEKGLTSSYQLSKLGGKDAKRYVIPTETLTQVIYIVHDIGKNNWGFQFGCLFLQTDTHLLKQCDNVAATFKFLD